MSQSEVVGHRLKVVPPEPSRIARGTSGSEAMSASATAWPVGSVFIGNVSTNPGTLFGFGTWGAVDSGIWMKIGSVNMYIWKRTA